jgi:hypothetical protein
MSRSLSGMLWLLMLWLLMLLLVLLVWLVWLLWLWSGRVRWWSSWRHLLPLNWTPGGHFACHA